MVGQHSIGADKEASALPVLVEIDTTDLPLQLAQLFTPQGGVQEDRISPDQTFENLLTVV